jgi:Rrf2 family protein
MVLLKDIARREELSLPYLERVITPLIAAGLVKSTRGARGGILLVKQPAEVKLTEVVQLLEGSIAPVDCVNDPRVCSRSAFCVTRDIWIQIKDAMTQVLDSTTLQDLVERQRQKEQTETGMYHI